MLYFHVSRFPYTFALSVLSLQNNKMIRLKFYYFHIYLLYICLLLFYYLFVVSFLLSTWKMVGAKGTQKPIKLKYLWFKKGSHTRYGVPLHLACFKVGIFTFTYWSVKLQPSTFSAWVDLRALRIWVIKLWGCWQPYLSMGPTERWMDKVKKKNKYMI